MRRDFADPAISNDSSSPSRVSPQLSVRVPRSLRDALLSRAQQEERTLSRLVQHALSLYLMEHEAA